MEIKENKKFQSVQELEQGGVVETQGYVEAVVQDTLPEDPVILGKEIKALKEKIKIAQYKENCRATYNIPHSALTDGDKSILEHFPQDKERLSRLLKKQVEIKQQKKPLLKRIAAFFTF
jgi:acetyl-CoA carboxylase carboxyltransferase component